MLWNNNYNNDVNFFQVLRPVSLSTPMSKKLDYSDECFQGYLVLKTDLIRLKTKTCDLLVFIRKFWNQLIGKPDVVTPLFMFIDIVCINKRLLWWRSNTDVNMSGALHLLPLLWRLNWTLQLHKLPINLNELILIWSETTSAVLFLIKVSIKEKHRALNVDS